MRKSKPRKQSIAQGREWTAQEIKRLTIELDKVRDEMTANVATWSHTQMRSAMERAMNIRNERNKLMK